MVHKEPSSAIFANILVLEADFKALLEKKHEIMRKLHELENAATVDPLTARRKVALMRDQIASASEACDAARERLERAKKAFSQRRHFR